MLPHSQTTNHVSYGQGYAPVGELRDWRQGGLEPASSTLTTWASIEPIHPPWLECWTWTTSTWIHSTQSKSIVWHIAMHWHILKLNWYVYISKCFVTLKMDPDVTVAPDFELKSDILTYTMQWVVIKFSTICCEHKSFMFYVTADICLNYRQVYQDSTIEFVIRFEFFWKSTLI